MLWDLPREILENIAIRALSLEMAYLIESDYAGMHIAKVKYSIDAFRPIYYRGQDFYLVAMQQMTNDQLVSSWVTSWMVPSWQTILVHSALTWEPRNQVTVVEKIEPERWTQYVWELAFRVRHLTLPCFLMRNLKHVDIVNVVNSWLGQPRDDATAYEERGEFAAKVTGMSWCRHCNTLWNSGDGGDICSHSCDSTQVVQKMLKWKSPVNYHFVAGSLANAMGVARADLQDQYRDKVYLNELLGLGKTVHTFIDQDDNWVIVSETSSKLSKLVPNLENVVRRLADCGVSSRYEILQQQPPVRTQYLCTHCCPPYKSAPKTRYERLYVLRMTPLDSKGFNLKTVSGQKEEKPLGSWNDTLLLIKLPEQSSNSRIR